MASGYLEGLPEEFVVLALVDDTKYIETNVSLIKELVNERNLSGVYITVNRPYNSLVKLLSDNKINTDRIFFIDLVTQTAGGSPKKESKVIFMNSPQSLTDLSIALTQAIEAMKGKKFLFLDSMSTLMVYNELGTMARFAHFLTGRMRIWNVQGVIISLKRDTDESFIKTLSQFCDRIITMKG